MSSLAERFFHRFAALDRVYGRYSLSKSALAAHKPGQKLEGGAGTVHDAPTAKLWEEHLSGKVQIGLVPIRDDRTCCWGAIDIDDYTVDHAALDAQLREMGLPLLMCRTKSGGAHLYCFTSEPVAAELMRGKLMEWAVALGRSGVEVFPKQTRLAGKNDDGSWINMPYSGGESSVRHAIYMGARLGPGAFLDLIDSTYAITEEKLRAIEAPTPEDLSTFFDGAPPCLQTLVTRGKITELRNQTLFSIIVMLKKMHGEDFKEEMVDEYNQRFIDPPLGHKELAHIIKSTSKKTYFYKCNDEPIRSVCNRQICLTRKFGIGGSDGDPGVVFGQLVKLDTDPPIWLWDVDGARIELSTDELQNQGRFQKRCIEVINKLPNVMKTKAWQDLVRERLTNIEIRPVPQDASLTGQIMTHLETYCNSRVKARDREELLHNKPWTGEVDMEIEGRKMRVTRTFFHGPDFLKYLSQQKVQVTSRQVWVMLEKIGAGHHFFNIKGRGINTWHIPPFPEQTEAFDEPDLTGHEEI
jgi:hypothetical protein